MLGLDHVGLALLSDFDGTIVVPDTAKFVLSKFARGDWKIPDAQFAKGEITLEKCMQIQLSMVQASKSLIIHELERVTVFRPNFRRLAEYCRRHSVPLIVVSAGLDFVIKHFLKINCCLDLVQVRAAKTRWTRNGIKLTFPKLLHKASVNFKDDLVRNCRGAGNEVIYVGNGTSDAAAAEIADTVFAIKDSALAMLCTKKNIPYKEIDDFQEVIEAIRAAIE